jgi:alcohol dehydrogenase (cytochrome c)
MKIKRLLRLFVTTVVLILVLGLAAIVAIPMLRWRATILFDLATGRLKDITWADISWMIRPGSGVYLEPLAKNRNPFLTIESPRHSKADIEAGGQLFSQQCSPCHGDNARGGPGGPNLHERVFRQGRSDWALYHTVTHGIPGTAMPGFKIPRDDVWKLVSYLQQTLVATEASSGEMPASLSSLQPVTAAELKNAADDSAEWLTYSGSYDGHRHSRLSQINRQNVAQLRVEWERQLSTTLEKVESTPLVRGSTMFVSEPPSTVLALDASSGYVLWSYTHDLPAQLKLCCGMVNRGVALLGDRVYFGTVDAHLIALNAKTGRVDWDIAVADYSKGYSITGAPLAVDDMVLTGVGGGEFGIRGIVDAYDAATGQRRWRFYTIPAAGEPGSETWEDGSLNVGGAPSWLTGSFDPQSRTVYWGIGNPSPNYNGQNRGGDNVYSNSVVALDADSGKLRWFYQFTPHDAHDWDSCQIPVLVDAVLNGEKRNLLAWANRNGFFYLLDRASGKFLAGAPFVKQNWQDGFDANGRPHVRPESVPSREGSLVYPSLFGGTNWWSPTYDPESELMYISTTDRGGVFYVSPDEPLSPEGFILGGIHMRAPKEDTTIAVKALELRTGHVRWQYTRPPVKALDQMGGLMSTAGGIIFGGERESLYALDSATGAELWHFEAGGQVLAAPVTYQLGKREYIAIAAGRSIITFALPQSDAAKKPPAAAR